MCTALLVFAVLVAGQGTAGAVGTVTLTGYGADTCTAPSLAQMKALKGVSPYWYWGVYIGGSDRGCAQPNLNAAWVSSVLAMNYRLLPLWVGRQNPCTPGQAAYFSRTPYTAYLQGKAEGRAAYAAWHTLSTAATVPISYDLEASSTDSTSCRIAAKSFINGWVRQLHTAMHQSAGIYSSACAGHLDDYAGIPHRPDFIDAADWDGIPSTGVVSCVSTHHWIDMQRHKQYLGGHNVTYNGVTLNIDSRCSDGPVYGTVNRIRPTYRCAGHLDEAARATLRASAEPLTWHGSTWRTGGPLDSQLQRAAVGTTSAAARFTAVPVGNLPIRTHEVSPAAPTIGTPSVLHDGSLLVPVTRHLGARSVVTLYTTVDGRRFVRRAELSVKGALGPGVAVPTAVRGGTQVMALGAGGSSAPVWSAAAGVGVTASTGLPAVPEAVDFSSARRGRAVVEVASCATGCAPQARAYLTADGGRTWHRD